MRYPRKRAAFTLIELLVVISIIALLISILLPALQHARELAKTIACASGLRQVQQGVLNYAHDHDGNLPYVYSNPPYQIWGGLIAAKGRYVPTAEIFWCPSHDVAPKVPSGWTPREWFAAMMDNPHAYSWAYTGYAAGRYSTMTAESEAPTYQPINIDAAEIPPSSLIVLSEVWVPGQAFGSVSSQTPTQGGWYYAVAGNDSYKLFTHQSDANVSFLDGHVETRKAASLGWDQQTRTWDSTFDYGEAPWFKFAFTR